MSRMCRAPCVNHRSHLWFSSQVQVPSGASDKVSGALPARLGQANGFKLCERQRQWRTTHAPRPSQVAEVVEETTEPILSPHTSGLAEFAGALHLSFLGQLHLLPLRVGVFHPPISFT